jgi:DNA-binding NarL/FixJ family response regulator
LAEQQRAAIALIDARALRRNGWVGLLSPWAEASGLVVEAIAPDAIASLQGTGTQFRLGILSFGATSLQAPQAAAQLAAAMEALPDTPLVVVSDLDDAAEVVAAFRAKARGFIPTTMEPEVALRTFAFIMSGGSFFPPTALFGRGPDSSSPSADINGRKPDDQIRRRNTLTGGQQEVMQHLAAGLTNKAIARVMGIRESTVKVHVRQIMRKLGATNRTQAALAAAATEPAIALPAALPAPLASDTAEAGTGRRPEPISATIHARTDAAAPGQKLTRLQPRLDMPPLRLLGRS